MKALRLFGYSGWAYVLCWVIGLILEPSSPGMSSSATDISSYYLSHKIIHVIQAYLIDGAAAIALLIFYSTLAVYFYYRNKDNIVILISMYGSGLLASSVSLVQAGFQQLLSGDSLVDGGISPNFVLSIISYLDTYKLLAMAIFILFASILSFKTNAFQPWIRWAGVLLSALLFAGGLSFVIVSSILQLVLFLSLPVLLIWVAFISTGLIRSSFSTTTIG